MKCPHCGATKICVRKTLHDTPSTITRYRRCDICNHRWFTVEHICPGEVGHNERTLPVLVRHPSPSCPH